MAHRVAAAVELLRPPWSRAAAAAAAVLAVLLDPMAATQGWEDLAAALAVE